MHFVIAVLETLKIHFFRHSSNGATVGGVWKQTSSGHSAFTGTALGSSGQVMVAGWYRISGT